MIRCPECGLRLRTPEPTCPVHGSVTSSSSAPPPAPGSGAPPAPSFTLEGYAMEGVLGEGGFGVVYRAERTQDSQKVAIKVASAAQRGARERLITEQHVLSSIGPPFVPAVYDQGLSEGHAYVVMELVEGATLAARLCQRGPASLADFARESLAVARAVEAVHARGYVHGDLKPENIFVTDARSARLIDFGSAWSITKGLGTDEDGPVLGTPEYMAPEQCEGRADLGPAVDVYALGVLLYEMLVGAPPFWGNAGEVREAQVSRRPARLTTRVTVAHELEDVVLRCLAKNPRQRYASVGELKAALTAALQQQQAHGSGGWTVVRSTPRAAAQLARRAAPVAAAPARAPQAREKRAVGLLFFESGAGVLQVTQALTALGGQLAQASASRYVGVFGHEVGDNPARVALLSAQRMLERQLCQRVLVDVAPVAIQMRPNGERRFFSTLFARKDRYPLLSDPRGILLTESAADVLSDVPRQATSDRPGVFRVELTDGADVTTFGTHGESLLGRDALLSDIREHVKAAFAGPRPSIVTVLGEPGYGKSLLASTVVQRLPQLGLNARVFKLAGHDSIGGASHATLRDLLRQLLRAPEGADGDFGEAFLTERIGTELGPQAWAAAALVLGWVPADHPQVRQLSAAPGALRSAAARAAGELLRRAAQKSPVLVVLDDAHLAEEAALDALEYATLREEGLPLCVCALARPSLLRARATWGTRAAAAHALTLPPLERQDAELLLRRLLEPVEQVPEVALQKLCERTHGIPRLMVELVHGLKRSGIVRRVERGAALYLATDELEHLPDLPVVQWSAAREIEGLSAQLAAHARLASVFGGKFRIGELEGVLRILEREAVVTETQLDAGIGVDRLLDTGLLQRAPLGQIDFRNAFLREMLYEALPDELKKAAHRAAVEMYERAGSLTDDERLPRLALHAARSGQRERAASTYLLLAERAQSRHAYLDAEVMYGSALANLGSDEDLAISNAAQGRGLMRFRLGRCEDAIKDFALAVSHARRLPNLEKELGLLLDEAMVLDWMGQYPPSAELGRAVAERTGDDASSLLRARLLMALGRSALRENQFAVCLEKSREAAALAEPLGDVGYETYVISMLLAGAAAGMLGHLEDAEALLDRAVAEAQSRGDLLHAAGARNNKVSIWCVRRDVNNIVTELKQVRRIARQQGFGPLEFHAEANLAEILYSNGDLEPAVEHIERSIHIGNQLYGQSLYTWRAELLQARWWLYRGDAGRARAILDAILERQARELAAGRSDAQLPAADQLLADMIDLATRPTSDEEWQGLRERCAAAGALQELVEVLEARALKVLRSGDERGGRGGLEEALEVARAAPGLLMNRITQSLEALAGV